MQRELPLWRSALFVPAHIERFIAKAHTRNADAIILDLEDSVPLAEKVAAREGIEQVAQRVGRCGADVIVRINSGWRLAVRDLEEAVRVGVSAICVPKVSCAQHMRDIDMVVRELEVERGLTVGSIGLIALIESIEALEQADLIAASTQRMVAIILGPEDFCASTGMYAEPEGLLYPNQKIIFAARKSGILALGFVGSIADFRDTQKFGNTIATARRLGFTGGFCIHPGQVDIMNEGYLPEEHEFDDARALVATYEEALRNGVGAVEYKGKMVDEPVVARAREILTLKRRLDEPNAKSDIVVQRTGGTL